MVYLETERAPADERDTEKDEDRAAEGNIQLCRLKYRMIFR